MNTFATTNAEIGEMLTRSSAAMKAANNSLEETIALESAAVEITRNAETTGTAFRTVSMRIRGLDEETEEQLENYDELKGKIADLTKTVKTPGGVSLFTDADKTEYKSTYQFLKDISEIYNDLTDKNQAALLETIGGKRGAQSLAGILADFSEVERAMDEMKGAAGAADKEMEVIQDSIDYKLNALKQTWIGTLQDVTDRESFKNILDGLTSLSGGLGDIISKLGLVKTAIIGVNAVIGSQKLGLFKLLKGDFSGLENFKRQLVEISLTGKSIREVNASIKGMGKLSRDIFTADGVNITSIEIYRKNLEGLTIEQKALALSTSNLTEAEIREMLTRQDNAIVSKAVSEAEAEAIISKMNLLSSTTLLTESEIQELGAKVGLEAQTVKNALVETGLVSVKDGDVVITEALTAAEIEEALTSEGAALADKKQTAQIIAETIAKKSATKATALYAGNTNLLIGLLNKLKIAVATHPILTFAAILGAGVYAIKKYKDSIDELIKSSNEAIDSYESKVGDLRKNQSEFSELSSRYVELSKGVNSLGENVSLTTTEFSEYKDVVNKIAELSPTLIKGYTDEGDAILKVKDNVNELTDAYNQQIIAENKSIEAQSKKLIDAQGKKEVKYNAKGNTRWQDETLEDFINGSLNSSELLSRYEDVYSGGLYGYKYKELTKLLRDELGIDVGFSKDDEFWTSKEEAKEFDAKLENTLNNLSAEERSILEGYISRRDAEYEEVFKGSRDILRAQIENSLLTNKDLKSLPQELQTALLNIADSLDVDVFRGLNSPEEIAAYANSITKAFKDLSDSQIDELELGINISTEWNNDEISYDEYVEKIQAFNALLNELFPDEEIQKSIRILFDIPDEEELSKQQDVFINRLGEKIFSGKAIEDTKLDTDKLKDDINKQLEELEKGGGVNLKLRPEIDTQLLKDAGWKDIEDGIATVYSSTFSDEEGSKYLNFTPIIINPETGEYKGVLSPDELTKYAEDVIAGTRTDDLNLQIGTEFDTLEEAENAAEKIHTLHERLSNLNNTSYIGSMVGMPSDVENRLKTQGTEVADAWYNSLTKSEREFVDNLSDTDLAEAVEFNSTEQFDEWLEKIKSEKIELEPEIKSTDAVKSLNDLESDWSGLDTVYQSTVNTPGGTAEAKDIESVNTNMGGIKDESGEYTSMANALEAYNDALVENKGDSKAAQEATDKLATAYIDQSGILDNLQESNADYYIEMLKARGVTNAEEVVMTRLSETAKNSAKAMTELSKSIAKYRDQLDNGSLFDNAFNGDTDAQNAISTIKGQLQDMLTMYDESGNAIAVPELDTTFIKQNLADIEAAVEGDIDAVDRLRIAAARASASKISIGVNIPTEAAEQQLDRMMEQVMNVDAMDIEVGASVDDGPFIATLANMIHAGQTTADQVAAAFESMGYTVEWKPHPYTATLVDTFKEHGNHGMQASDIAAMAKQVQIQMDVPELTIKRSSARSGARTNFGGTPSGGSNNGGGNTNGGSDSDSSANESEETFDWVEVAIQRVEDQINHLDEAVENVYSMWTDRNKNLRDEIAKTEKELELQATAEDIYLAKAKDVGLDKAYRTKVEQGEAIDINSIETVNKEELINKINEYKQWWEKYKQAQYAQQTLEIKLGDQYKKNFEQFKENYEEQVSLVNSYADLIDKRLNRVQEKGYFESTKYYEELKKYENQNIKTQQTELDKLIKARDEAVASGRIKYGSQAWREMTEEIYGVASAIEESTTKIIQWDKQIRQLKWDIFDFTQERIDQINQEADFIVDLLDNQKMFEDDGRFNERGEAATAMHASKYNVYMKQADDYAKERAKIEKQLADDPADKELIKRKEELIKLQQESIANAYKEKEAVKDLVQEGINIHLEALQELIDKYKESLSNAKDLYDYQKNIASQTKNITNLQKQLSAYEGDTSEEARATIQKLRKQLEDAETQLKETEWDKYISETEKFLDDMYEDYEELLNEYLEDIDKLMNDMITDTNKNAGDIKTAIENVSGAVGYELTKEMQKIISGKNIATDYGDNGFDNTKTYKAITGIKTQVKAIKDQMVKEAADAKKKANTNVKGATSYNGVDYSSVFDLDYYMEHNADLKKKFGTDYNKYIEHFVNHGMKEGRQGSSTFNVQTYKKNYKDLQKAYGNDLVKYYEHYIKYGKKEGRKAYAKGSKYIPYDQLAWTQEEGQELIFRKSDGAMLTPLGAGDKVFTAQMTDNLYDLAKASVNVKPFVPESTFNGGNDVDISIAVDKVVADNPEQFARQLIQTLKNNSKAESIIQEMTLGQAMGNGKLNKRKY